MWKQRLAITVRAFSTSARVEGKRSREPFDKRFPVTGKHGGPRRKGGSQTMEKFLAVHNVQPAGYIDKKKGRYTNVPEMIPDFVVPDLTGFELKPYVSYKASEIQQTKMTARDLFQATYAAELQKDINEGKVVIKDEEFVRLNTGKDDKR
ncbi:large ribosomal subunit protein mL41-like [Littorina saxatilis]|uniref:Mitochondrial ribosomal protein L41 n=1 Tax=Littorina saxatilis TaxID=31220 RepID=A0AAN9GE76_9CAEN